MPYSDHPPDIVCPDTDFGHEDARRFRSEGMVVGYCDEFSADGWPVQNDYAYGLKVVCGNRRPEGVRSHNWCFRCQYGFAVWRREDTESNRLTI